jgi:hypothetical protein
MDEKGIKQKYCNSIKLPHHYLLQLRHLSIVSINTSTQVTHIFHEQHIHFFMYFVEILK